MKKWLSLLLVIAIVTSTFAFTTNRRLSGYCVYDNSLLTCNVLYDQTLSPTGTAYLHYPMGPGQWDGSWISCFNASIGTDCVVLVRLVNN